MVARSTLRGHPIFYDGSDWRFCDSGEKTEDAWESHPCGHCKQHDTKEGHDHCLGTLPGVMNACCGHGVADAAYLQFNDGRLVFGAEALKEARELMGES